MKINILVIRMSAIGDIIHTLPAIFFLKQSLPQAKISWVVQQKAAALLVDQPFLENVWVLPDRFLSPAHWKITYRTIKELQSRRWDAIIDFQGLIKTSIFYAFLSGKKYGFGHPHAREYISTWFTHIHHNPTYTHIIQKNLSLASFVATHFNSATTCPSLDALRTHHFTFNVSAHEKTVAHWLMDKHIGKFILFCPNTTWQSKRWPTQKWTDCFRFITEHPQVQNGSVKIIIVGSFHGRDAADLITNLRTQKLPVTVAPAWDLLTTAALISKASLIVAPDTGLLHLADLWGTKTLGIFGPTFKEKHGPFLTPGNRERTIQVPCPHHYQKEHGEKNIEHCMDMLDSATVSHQILQCLEKEATRALN